LILDHGAEVDSQDYDAYTPLHHSSIFMGAEAGSRTY
jgi:hypothetical protein